MILQEGLGILDASEEEIELLISRRAYPIFVEFTLADMISLRARIGVPSHFLFGLFICILY